MTCSLCLECSMKEIYGFMLEFSSICLNNSILIQLYILFQKKIKRTDSFLERERQTLSIFFTTTNIASFIDALVFFYLNQESSSSSSLSHLLSVTIVQFFDLRKNRRRLLLWTKRNLIELDDSHFILMLQFRLIATTSMIS